MTELQTHFIESSINVLNDLQEIVLSRTDLTVGDFNKLFRRLHTIKGTAQTFGLINSAAFAHEIENYLTASQTRQIEFDPLLFSELINALKESLKKADYKIPSELRKKIKLKKQTPVQEIASGLPNKITERLSAAEKKAVNFVNQRGDSLLLVEMFCNLKDFPDCFKPLREKIEKSGQLIAVLPQPLKNSKIGVQILCAGEFSDGLSGTPIIFKKSSPANEEELSSICRLLTTQTQKLALERDKSVEIITQIDRLNLPSQTNEKIFEILLHLSRNAVDHAIETPDERIALGKSPVGKINISITKSKNRLIITFSDDGRGIDARLVEQKASEKNLILVGQNLDDEKKLELIFLPGVSTTENVNEISGRGVGLDIVRETIKKLDGEISVESEIAVGTTFGIILPSNKDIDAENN